MDPRPPQPESAGSRAARGSGQPGRSEPWSGPSLESASDAPPSEGAGEGTPSPALPKIIPFQSLARCGEEIWIENEGQVYRLRRTRQGKLILTK